MSEKAETVLEPPAADRSDKMEHKARRRSSTRRMSFNRRSSSVPATTSSTTSAWKICQNMRRGMRARFEAARKELVKAQAELGIDADKLSDLYKNLSSLEISLGVEGDVLEEELLAILSDPENLVGNVLEQVPLKKARLDPPPAPCLRSPVTEIARRLEEWGASDGVDELLKKIVVDPLTGLRKNIGNENISCESPGNDRPVDLLEEELESIQKSISQVAELQQQQRAELLKRRQKRQVSLPSYMMTVERLAKQLEGTVM